MSADFYEKFAIAVGILMLIAGVGYSFWTVSLLPLILGGAGAAVWFFMQLAIAGILRNQEEILDRLRRQNAPPSVPVSNSRLDLRKAAASSDEWLCASCGGKNPKSSRYCRECGQPK